MYSTVIDICDIPHHIFGILPREDRLLDVVYTTDQNTYAKLSEDSYNYINNESVEIFEFPLRDYLIESGGCDSISVGSLQEFCECMEQLYQDMPESAKQLKAEWGNPRRKSY